VEPEILADPTAGIGPDDDGKASLEFEADAECIDDRGRWR
jgi:hypothetical protein